MWTKADQELVIPTGMSLLLFYHLLTASNFMCRLQSLHRFFLTNVNVFYEFLAFSFFSTCTNRLLSAAHCYFCSVSGITLRTLSPRLVSWVARSSYSTSYGKYIYFSFHIENYAFGANYLNPGRSWVSLSSLYCSTTFHAPSIVLLTRKSCQNWYMDVVSREVVRAKGRI